MADQHSRGVTYAALSITFGIIIANRPGKLSAVSRSDGEKLIASMHSIRRATASDYAAVSKCIDRAYVKYIDRLGQKPAPMLADYSRLMGQQIVYVIGSRRVIQAVMVLFREGHHMHLGNLAVDPDYQKRGLGSAMMRFAEEQTISNGLGEIRLFTNVLMTENLDYYSEVGYREYDRRTEDGYARVFMKKTL